MSHLNHKRAASVLGSLVTAAFLFACITPSAIAADPDVSYSIARGARLYDTWWEENNEKMPVQTHNAWPSSNTRKKGAVTWRCKSCHGWDYLGKDGYYSVGDYDTGIKGITKYDSATPAEIAVIIRDDTHGYTESMLDDDDLIDLANFVSMGQVDMSKYIDKVMRTTIGGNAARGLINYDLLCSTCHKRDGTAPVDLDGTMGRVAIDKPWEVLHKTLYGQPGDEMIALMGLDIQISIDILAYVQTLRRDFPQ